MASTVIRFLFIGLFMAGAPPAWAADKTDEKFVRVAILNDVEELTVSIRGQYEIVDPKSNAVVLKGRGLENFKISMGKTGIQLNEQLYPLQRLYFKPGKYVTLHIKDQARRYRGVLEIVQKPDNKFLVINAIELEQYLKGVLYHEVSHRWPMEAMKAQAVAARTYVLYQMKKNAKDDYDVTGDIYSQVYGGKSAERFRTNIAANRTRGEILVYANKLLPAYFHASCGGHTENARNIWGHNLPPLAGVVCSFCQSEPNFRWKRNFRSKDIQDKLNARGYTIGPISEIRILDRNESGRINNLMIISRNGSRVRIPGIKFRELIGPNTVRSNNYEVAMKGYYFDLIGKGWGHGVGMCQWGAHRMAKERYDYDEILAFYYPGAEIVDYRTRPPEDLP